MIQAQLLRNSELIRLVSVCLIQSFYQVRIARSLFLIYWIQQFLVRRRFW